MFNYKIILGIILAIVAMLIIASLFFLTPQNMKCIWNGGIVRKYSVWGNSVKYCIFFDKSICNLDKLNNGQCQRGKCLKECLAVGTRSEGWYDSCLKGGGTNGLLKYDNCLP